MAENSRLKINFKLPNQNDIPPGKVRKPTPKQLTMKQALAVIESKNLEPDIKDELVKRISRYPSNTLNTAFKNIAQIISEITQKIRQDRAEEEAAAIPSAFAAFKERNQKAQNHVKEVKPQDDPEEPTIQTDSEDGEKPVVREDNRPTRRRFAAQEESQEG